MVANPQVVGRRNFPFEGGGIVNETWPPKLWRAEDYPVWRTELGRVLDVIPDPGQRLLRLIKKPEGWTPEIFGVGSKRGSKGKIEMEDMPELEQVERKMNIESVQERLMKLRASEKDLRGSILGEESNEVVDFIFNETGYPETSAQKRVRVQMVRWIEESIKGGSYGYLKNSRRKEQ